jgi:methyl-accepting chemotaxis protein
MSIRTKIGVLVAIPVVGLALLLLIGWQSISTVDRNRALFFNEAFLPIVSETIPELIESQDSISLILNADRDAHQAVIAERLAIVSALDETDENYQKANAENRENIQQVQDRMALAATKFKITEMKEIYGQFQADFQVWQEKSRQAVEYAIDPEKMRFAPKISNGSGKAAFDTMRNHMDKLEQLYDEHIQHRLAEVEKQKTVAQAINRDLQQNADRSVFLFVVLVIVFVVISALVGVWLAIKITRPLSSLQELVLNVEESGDLALRSTIKSKDEIGSTATAFNILLDSIQKVIAEVNAVIGNMAQGDLTSRVTGDHKGDLSRLKTDTNESLEMLSGIIAEVLASSEQVKIGAVQLSASSQSLASGTTEQAASLEEASSAMSEIDARTRANSENALSALQLTEQTTAVVKKANAQMHEMLNSINEINNSSADVSKIIRTIDEIAFQTNLLALNAAVEAARAGKYGKGFAVVAEEVRNLAARSALAAKNSTGLIENSGKEVEKGVANAGKAAAVLVEINEFAKKVNAMVQSISEASKQQTLGIDEINRGLAQVNKVVQDNSSISEETASASDELSAQANRLQELMAHFKLRSQHQDQSGQRAEYLSTASELEEELLPSASKSDNPHLLTSLPKTLTLEAGEFVKNKS